MSNTYYPALAQPHVDVVTDGIAAVRPNAIVAADGAMREVDAIVVATGFHVTDSPTNECIIGRGGHSLADSWRRAGAQAYKGSTVHGFPNLFVMTGPGTGSGHTSAVFMIESQLNYLRDLIRTTSARGIATVEVREDVQTATAPSIQRGLRKSVWETGGCSSWYRDRSGKITTNGQVSRSASPTDPHLRPQRLPRGACPRLCPPPLRSTRLQHDVAGRVRSMPSGPDRCGR